MTTPAIALDRRGPGSARRDRHRRPPPGRRGRPSAHRAVRLAFAPRRVRARGGDRRRAVLRLRAVPLRRRAHPACLGPALHRGPAMAPRPPPGARRRRLGVGGPPGRHGRDRGRGGRSLAHPVGLRLGRALARLGVHRPGLALDRPVHHDLRRRCGARRPPRAPRPGHDPLPRRPAVLAGSRGVRDLRLARARHRGRPGRSPARRSSSCTRCGPWR